MTGQATEQVVKWFGPASPGQAVYYQGIVERYCAHPHGSGEPQPGWTFVEHLDGEQARVKVANPTTEKARP